MHLVSSRGDTIIDCCSGSGSLGLTFLMNGRNVIFIEKDQQMIAVIKERLKLLAIHKSACSQPVEIPKGLLYIHREDDPDTSQKQVSSIRAYIHEKVAATEKPNMSLSTWTLAMDDAPPVVSAVEKELTKAWLTYKESYKVSESKNKQEKNIFFYLFVLLFEFFIFDASRILQQKIFFVIKLLYHYLLHVVSEMGPLWRGLLHEPRRICCSRAQEDEDYHGLLPAHQ